MSVFFARLVHIYLLHGFWCDAGAVWIITSLSMVSTSLLLLDDTQLLWLFWGISLALGLVLPAWKFLLQSKKIMLKGPWVIPSAATMQLDFQGSDRP